MAKPRKKKDGLIKIPVYLAARNRDGPTGEQRWLIEVPPEYAVKAAGQLEGYKQQYYLLFGPFENEKAIGKAIENLG